MLLSHSNAIAHKLTNRTGRKPPVAVRIAMRRNRSAWRKKVSRFGKRPSLFGPDGAESFSSINEVVEFSQATLDPSLFDVPAGYREVKDFASLYSQPTSTSTESEPASNVQTPATPATQQTTATPQNTTPAAEPRKEENPVKKGLKSLKPKW